MRKILLIMIFSGLCAIIINSCVIESPLIDTNKYSQIINLDATKSNNQVSLNLEPGIYDIEYIGTAEGGKYNAWNPWGSSSYGCNFGGTNCVTGWVNKYHYNIASTNFTQILSSGSRYATPLLALATSVDTRFSLTKNDVVSFYILDQPYTDNVGGVSLKIISRTTTSKPITFSGLAFIGMIVLIMQTKNGGDSPSDRTKNRK